MSLLALLLLPFPWLIVIVLAITVPVTTLLLARAALFRRRAAGAPNTPPRLTPDRSPDQRAR